VAANSRIRAKLLRGEPVRFDAEKHTEKQREVPAEWVAEALREGRRVELVNAILTGPLDLQSARVEQEFILLGGEVRGPVNAFYARFARWVAFRDVRFQDSVSLKGARFAAELNCSGTHFLKGVDFQDTIIEGSLVATRVEFGSSKEDQANFNGCEIRCAANFALTVFHGPAQFFSLTVGKQANFSGARFEHKAAFDGAEIGGNLAFSPAGEQRVEFGGEARFHGVKVSGAADFGGARFEHRAAFDGAEIGGAFFFRPTAEHRVEFGGEARFLGVKVSGEANFSGARFEQKVAFDGAEIEGSLFFHPQGEQRVEFGGEARFHGVKVGGQAAFNGARFEHRAAFDGAEIGGDFFFSPEGKHRVEFGGEARFHGVKVGGQAVFSGARFKQEVSFQSATVEGEAGFVGVEFQKAVSFQRAEFKAGLYFAQPQNPPTTFSGKASFHGIKVGGQAAFNWVRFEEEAAFEGAVFSGVTFFHGASFSDLVSFATARFQLAAEFQGAQFQGPADFDYARFEQEAHFAGAKFGGQLKLRDTHMTTLSFLEGHEEKEKKKKVAVFHPGFKVDLLGCAYDRLEIDGWRKLMDRQSEFNPRPWSQLEKTLRAAGHKAEADDVYYDRREREGKQIRFRKRPGRSLLDFIEQNVAGYGVRNRLVLAWIALSLVAFTWVFQHPGAIVRKQTDTKPAAESVSTVSPAPKNPAAAETPPVQLRWGDALAFSLKTFLPIEIPVARDWEPRPGWYSAWAAVLNLLGWILIPVALATVTGWMRRAHPD
jgi:uncharacterized protein YjbI with pentapeptide repeats